MRLGLFGGSFDPVHIGHLLVAQAAMEELGLDRLVFIPAAQSPFKPGSVPAPASLRLRMLRLSLAGQSQFEVDEWEIRRGGVSYSIDTAREFRRRHPEVNLLWLVGADHVVTLPQWREAETLAELAEFVVIPRPGDVPVQLPLPFRLRQLKGWPLKISSSEVRDRIQAGKTCHGLLPPGVAEVIAAEGLYRG